MTTEGHGDEERNVGIGDLLGGKCDFEGARVGSVLYTNPSRQWALVRIRDENAPMESWRYGIPAGRRVTPTLTRSLSISSHAAASRREESSKADRSSSISRSFALPPVLSSAAAAAAAKANGETPIPQIHPPLTHPLAPRCPSGTRKVLDRVGRLKCIDGRERESEGKSGGGALSSEAFERQARSRTFGHLGAKERAHTCVQYRPTPLHHHQPRIYMKQGGEE